MIKVLIVEDEAGIRSSLANAYSWSEMECELLAAPLPESRPSRSA